MLLIMQWPELPKTSLKISENVPLQCKTIYRVRSKNKKNKIKMNTYMFFLSEEADIHIFLIFNLNR